MTKSIVTRAATLCLLALLSTVQTAGAEQQRIGLVLSGGGARGVAHVGVIQALEEMRVPVHAIAGTSMGALVGGLYATGMSSDDLQEITRNMRWEDAFKDKPDRKDRPMRRKQDDYDYPIETRLAIRDGKLSFPLGLVQGQRASMLIKDLMVQAETIKDFDQLFIPYRAVAANVETGKSYVFSRGDIVLAMRTSMSMPGIFAPTEHEGLLLVDGGIADNLPVGVARSMGVDKLIVVNIGTELATREEMTSLLSVTGQMINMLTARNTQRQLETLTPEDILISPDLDGIGALSFDKYQDAYERGYHAALALKTQLQGLGLDEGQWAEYVASRPAPQTTEPVVAFIHFDNQSQIDQRLVAVRLRQQLGEPLDREQLVEDIDKIFGMDYFQTIDYEVVTEADQTGLLIKLKEKSWGTDNFKFGFNAINDLDGDSQFNAGVSLRKKGLNRLGAEWLARAQVGDTVLLDTEFYQPVGFKSRFFVVPYLGYKDYDVLGTTVEGGSERVLGGWRVRRGRFDFEGGVNLFDNSQVRLGLFRATGDYRIDIGSEDLGEGSFNEGGGTGVYTYDSLDDAYFPTQGAYLYAGYNANRTQLGADTDFDRWLLQALGAFSFGKEEANTFIISGKTAQNINASDEPQNLNLLGGLFNLSGFPQNSLARPQLLFAMLQYQRRLTGKALIPLNAPIYAGFSLEGGNLWDTRSDVSFGDLRGAGSIYLAVDSPIGPIYVAYGRSGASSQSIYFSLGWPFYSQDNFRR
jgi:NTE family protein